MSKPGRLLQLSDKDIRNALRNLGEVCSKLSRDIRSIEERLDHTDRAFGYKYVYCLNCLQNSLVSPADTDRCPLCGDDNI